MPNPCDYDKEEDFHADCMAERQHANPQEEIPQSNAICFSMWRERDCNKQAQEIINRVLFDIERFFQ